jgi:heterogeneous nuclear ribonucleoprotein U-like protein 1
MLRVNICLQKLIEIAAQRRRNYIIDHVNITRETQSKRQRLFTGYHRIGVVIIPDDDELRIRIDKLEKLENISIPSQWIREAKTKFYFPQKSSSLEDVIYPELSYEDAKSLYDKVRRDNDQHRSSSSRYDRHDDYRSSRHERNRYDDRDRGSRDKDRDRYDRHDRSRSRERGSRDRDRRTSRDDSRYSSSRRNDNYRGSGYSRGGGGGYSDYRQDSRNNNYNQRGGFHEGGYHGRGGNNYNNNNNNNQSSEGWRGGFHQQQRNDYGGGRGRGGNQFNNRGSYHDNQRGGGFRSDFNNQPRNRQFNEYDKNSQHQGNSSSGGFMQNNNNNNNFNQQNDRQGFGSRVNYLIFLFLYFHFRL